MPMNAQIFNELAALAASRARLPVWQLILDLPVSGYTLAEIKKLTGRSISAIRRGVTKLVEEDLFWKQYVEGDDGRTRGVYMKVVEQDPSEMQ